MRDSRRQIPEDLIDIRTDGSNWINHLWPVSGDIKVGTVSSVQRQSIFRAKMILKK